MPFEQLAPGSVAELAHSFGRADDVGHDDRAEQAVRERRRPHTSQELLDLGGGLRNEPGQVLRAGSEDEPRAWNPLGDVRALGTNRPLGMEHERRSLDQRQRRAYVDVDVVENQLADRAGSRAEPGRGPVEVPRAAQPRLELVPVAGAVAGRGFVVLSAGQAVVVAAAIPLVLEIARAP